MRAVQKGAKEDDARRLDEELHTVGSNHQPSGMLNLGFLTAERATGCASEDAD